MQNRLVYLTHSASLLQYTHFSGERMILIKCNYVADIVICLIPLVIPIRFLGKMKHFPHITCIYKNVVLAEIYLTLEGLHTRRLRSPSFDARFSIQKELGCRQIWLLSNCFAVVHNPILPPILLVAAYCSSSRMKLLWWIIGLYNW